MTSKIAPQKLFNMAVLDLLNEATVKTIELQEENEKLKKEIEYKTQECSDLFDIIKCMRNDKMPIIKELEDAYMRFTSPKRCPMLYFGYDILFESHIFSALARKLGVGVSLRV